MGSFADTLDTVTRALCAEQCAYRGEPPCFAMRDDQGARLPWPNPNCDDPGCPILAAVAIDAMRIAAAARIAKGES